MVELTQQTKDLVEKLFAPQDHFEVSEILLTRLGDNLPNIGRITPTNTNIERIRYGALKLSGGDLQKLKRVAVMDWRDIMVAAGFANSLTLQKQWAEETLKPES